jgi:hypothetical protein
MAANIQTREKEITQIWTKGDSLPPYKPLSESLAEANKKKKREKVNPVYKYETKRRSTDGYGQCMRCKEFKGKEAFATPTGMICKACKIPKKRT